MKISEKFGRTILEKNTVGLGSVVPLLLLENAHLALKFQHSRPSRFFPHSRNKNPKSLSPHHSHSQMRFSNPHSFSNSQRIKRLFSIDSQPSLTPLPVISFDSQPPLFYNILCFVPQIKSSLFLLTIRLKSTMQFFVKRSNFKDIDVCVHPKSSIESGNACLWSYRCSCLRQFRSSL
jgi:hypothetical protein